MVKSSKFSAVTTISAWFSLHLLLLIISFSAAWGINAGNGFFYSFWYDYYGIEKTIDHYGPLNRYKNDFEKTDKAERVRLFEGIVTSIHNSGEGLSSLSYYDSNGKKLGDLLRKPEIEHLQDVSHLINGLTIFSVVIIFLTMALFILLKRFKLPHPAPLKLLIPAAILLIVLVLMIVIVGPKELFYWLHIQIFSADHQWFFYYEDSLMSTMMKAPDIFAGITIAITVTAFMILIFVEMLLFRSLPKRFLQSR